MLSFSLCLIILNYWTNLQTHIPSTQQQAFFNYCFLSWRYWPPSTLHWLLVWGTPLEINTHWQCWFPCVMVSKVDFYIFWRKYVRVLPKQNSLPCQSVAAMQLLMCSEWFLTHCYVVASWTQPEVHLEMVYIVFFSVIFGVFVISSSRNCRPDCLKRIVRGHMTKIVHSLLD